MKTIEEMEAYALKHRVPIMQKAGMDFLCSYIKEHKITSILEVGTAIGYSAIRMAQMDENIHIVSIERDEERYQQALTNIKDFNMEERIKVIFGDALEVEVHGEYDLIFIDAAKAQYTKFFERYLPLLKVDGCVISDNIEYHGFVHSDEEIKSRRLRRLVRKMREYIEFLETHDDFQTTFHEIGDGVAVSIRKK